MKMVRNKTGKPIKVPLGGGRVLHLGPHMTGQVAAAAAEHERFVRLIDDGEIEMLDQPGDEEAPTGPRVVRETTHGHKQRNVVVPSGDRPGAGRGNR